MKLKASLTILSMALFVSSFLMFTDAWLLSDIRLTIFGCSNLLMGLAAGVNAATARRVCEQW